MKNNNCESCPPVQNATFNTPNSCDFHCHLGYVKKNNKCEPCTPVQNATFKTPNSCAFECDKDYVKKNNKCICEAGKTFFNNACRSCSTVKNATFTTPNSCAFKCNSGYVKKNNKCEVKLTTCPAGKTLDAGNNVCNSCSSVSNARFTTANSCAFTCNSGYVKKNNKCEVKLTTCPVGKYLRNNVCNSCSSVSNARFTTANSCAFACNSGYVKRNNANACDRVVCIKTYEKNKYLVTERNNIHVNANRNSCGAWEKFTFEPAGSGTYGIRNTYWNKYLSCQPNGTLQGNRSKLDSWEKFRIVNNGGGLFRFDVWHMEASIFKPIMLEAV